MSAKPTLNIIGAGKLGRTLGRLFACHGVYEIGAVMCRTQAHAQEAVAFIGHGTPCCDISALRPASVTLIGTADDHIAPVCSQLAQAGLFRAGDTVFHCSGALPADVLAAASGAGCAVASIHPMRSFANPEQVASSFAGTWCGVEGQADALSLFLAGFASIGARTVPIHAADKTLYHAAAVFASNYLVTILDVALSVYARAGVPRTIALEMIAPLVRGSVENVLANGPENALTGPVQRGDLATVENHYRALRACDPRSASLYRQLARAAAVLARRVQ
ncbi:MAG: Rossmann-like and DUF2520 domain-containing protein [Janthinobacterium lividum]